MTRHTPETRRALEAWDRAVSLFDSRPSYLFAFAQAAYRLEFVRLGAPPPPLMCHIARGL